MQGDVRQSQALFRRLKLQDYRWHVKGERVIFEGVPSEVVNSCEADARSGSSHPMLRNAQLMAEYCLKVNARHVWQQEQPMARIFGR